MNFLTRKNLATLTLVVLVSCGVVFGIGADRVWGQVPGSQGPVSQTTIAEQEKVDKLNAEAKCKGKTGPDYDKCIDDEKEISAQNRVEANRPAENSAVANFIGWVLFYIASSFSTAVGFLIETLVQYIVIYNEFVNHKIVSTGWTIVRDVANNFFIVILLVIAVATTLRQPAQYQYQSALPKLLIMAVLINFSKLFTGILIDISQILTIFFANALISGNARQVILVSLGLGSLYEAKNWSTFGNPQVILQLILALVMSVVAVVVILSLAMMLVVRIITLWFLIILSPAAFFAYAVPGGQQYFSQWWGRLTKELIVGPVAMFFLYLSLFAGAVTQTSNLNDRTTSLTGGSSVNSVTDIANPAAEVPAFGTFPEQMFNFLIVIGLLVMTLVAAQTVGAEGSKFAGAGLAKLNGWKNKGVSFGKKYTVDAAAGLGKYAAKSAAGKAWSGAKGVGLALDAASGGKLSGAISGVRRVATEIPGVTGAAATGAAIGAIGGPIGAAIGGALGLGISTYLRSTASGRQKRQDDQQEIAKAESAGDGGEYRDESGTKIDEAQAMQNHASGKSVFRYDNTSGAYIKTSYNSQTGNIDDQHERELDASGNEQTHATRTNYIGDYLDNGGSVSTVAVPGGYQWDGSKYVKIANTNPDKLKDENGKIANRYGEAKLSDGNTYRRATEDGSYHRVNDKGEFVKSDGTLAATIADAQEAKINGATGVLGQETIRGGKYSANTAMNRVRDAWYGSSDKGRAVKDAAQMKKVSEHQKNYDNMDKELLQRLFTQEGDLAKKQAIALALAVKDGFKDAGMVDQAKQTMATNKAMLKSFNDSMNKKSLVLNHTRVDKNGNTTIDEAGIRKVISSGKAKWTDQDLKTMNPTSLALMSQMRGDKFESDLDMMINSTADKGMVANKLRQGLDSRGFVGSDLAMRRAYAVHSSNLEEAFTGNGTLNTAELEKAVRNISNPAAFAGFSPATFNQSMKEAMAGGLTMNHFHRMNNSDKVGPAKIGEYIAMLWDVSLGPAGPAQANALKVLDDLSKNSALKHLV